MLKKIKSFLLLNKLIVWLGLVYFIVFGFAVIYGFFTHNERIPNLQPSNNFSFVDIFSNNMLVSLSMLGIGSLTGGMMSAIILFYNGYLIGKLLQYLDLHDQWLSFWTGLVPHAVLEIPGLLIFSIISTYPFILIYGFLKGLQVDIKHTVKLLLRLAALGIVLLLLASLVEDYVSFVH